MVSVYTSALTSLPHQTILLPIPKALLGVAVAVLCSLRLNCKQYACRDKQNRGKWVHTIIQSHRACPVLSMLVLAWYMSCLHISSRLS